MKKVLLTIGAMAMATGVFAQGYVTLGNGSGTLIDTNQILSPFLGGPGGGVQNVGTSATSVGASPLYYVALLTMPYSGTLTTATNPYSANDGWIYTGISTQNKPSGQPGTVSQLTDVATASGTWGIGTTQQFMIVAWSANLGSSWLAVSNTLDNPALLSAQLDGGAEYGYLGVSAVSFEAAQPAPSAPAAVLWSSTLGGQTYGNPISTGIPLYQIIVPEPTTLALAVLGGLSLVLIRRRKS